MRSAYFVLKVVEGMEGKSAPLLSIIGPDLSGSCRKYRTRTPAGVRLSCLAWLCLASCCLVLRCLAGSCLTASACMNVILLLYSALFIATSTCAALPLHRTLHLSLRCFKAVGTMRTQRSNDGYITCSAIHWQSQENHPMETPQPHRRDQTSASQKV